MKIKKLRLNELCADLYLVVGTFKEVQSVCKQSWFTDLEEDYSEVKWLCICKESKMMACVFTENTKKDDYRRTLMHEIIHAVHYVFDYKAFDISYDHWTENLAYYMSYYIEEWDKFLDEITKKKRWTKKRNTTTKRERKSKDKRVKSIQG